MPDFDYQSLSGGVSPSGNSPFDTIIQTADRNNQWSAEQAAIQRDWQENLFNRSLNFNSAEAAKNRSWQEQMSNTAHQREILDLKAAGLNPVLSATGGNGATVGSGSAASIGGAPSGAKGDTDESSTGAIASYLAQLLAAETSIRNTETSAQAALAGSQLMSSASEFAAMQAAGAQMYGANINLQNSREQREFTAMYPTTPTQAVGAVVNSLGGLGQVNNMLSAAGQAANQAGQSLRQAWNRDGIKGVITAIGEGIGSLFKRKK